jgi:pimeloyl-ACP methyl ester carboxylesterase
LTVLGTATMERITLRWNGLESTADTLGSGPIVLCLHGFPDHARSFRHQLPALAAAGFRAIAPALRGYEPSSQPDASPASYHPVRVAHDVIEWARQLSPEPVHLIGHDWGAVVTDLAIHLAPERFARAATMAVPPLAAVQSVPWRLPRQLRLSWYMFFFQLRGIADRAVARDDFAFLERLWRDWSPGWRRDPADMAALKETFRKPGVLRAALGYYRATFNPLLRDSLTMQQLARRPYHVPLLAITGARDGCMDTRTYDLVDPALFKAGLRIERIAGAGHFVHQEKPDEINRLLIDWLTQR